MGQSSILSILPTYPFSIELGLALEIHYILAVPVIATVAVYRIAKAVELFKPIAITAHMAMYYPIINAHYQAINQPLQPLQPIRQTILQSILIQAL